ncbi:DUF2867 domain-containing protein [Vibrio sp. SCSIO 43135]|uniref:DUF2867 domain-containing protein n=1 Tax=Vibrio paucivorans TaxID=2829489 RepID=A0A9X3CEE2_9VIBR|nr:MULTISPECIES: DUF2867 domain-containing protein [Vibrio]MCW8334141.1 DUF2867 domain-containing protein [Vibrio paucivorans]USD42934.1 DUF2867 domain-containing protein [Vibrio sp. SCSIO 43135]
MNFPPQSVLATYTHDAYFFDSFSRDVRYSNESALDVYFMLVQQTPSWVNRLMALRNHIVGYFGLKNLGKMADIDFNKPHQDYRVGDRLGIFTIYSISEKEIVLEDRDKHLDVKVSFYLEPDGDRAKVHASTVVHVHNMLGKVYMLFVAPMHKIIVPSSMNQLPILLK